MDEQLAIKNGPVVLNGGSTDPRDPQVVSEICENFINE